MSDVRRELVEAEDRGWAEVQALVSPLSEQDLMRDGYHEDWSVKDLLAHFGCWLAECGVVLEQIRRGTHAREHIDVDALNARWYETWREQDLSSVKGELHSARARLLDEWQRTDEPNRLAQRWFRESTSDHYDDHLPRLREWVAELRGEPSPQT